jgi:hypothetical protein
MRQESSVITLQVAPGAYVNDPTAAMMTIANLDTVWVTANVPEKDVSFIYPGQTVKAVVRVWTASQPAQQWRSACKEAVALVVRNLPQRALSRGPSTGSKMRHTRSLHKSEQRTKTAFLMDIYPFAKKSPAQVAGQVLGGKRYLGEETHDQCIARIADRGLSPV